MTHSIQSSQRPLDFCSKVYRITEVAIQTAVRAIFVVGAILATAAAFPLSLHTFAIPSAAFAAAILSGFFFPEPKSVLEPNLRLAQPLICPIRPDGLMAPNIPEGAPRLLKNTGNNCAFNSIVHFMECDPEVAQFWRNQSLTPEVNLETFIAFINIYEPSDQLIEDFRAYHREAHQLHIPDLFLEFINQYRSDLVERTEVNQIRMTYEDLQKLLPSFNRFFAGMDQTIQGNLAICRTDSLILRIAGNKVTEEIPSDAQQVDAEELLTTFCNVFPPSMKIPVETEYHLRTWGLPDVAPEELPILKRERESVLKLQMKNEPFQNVQDLLEQYCNSTDVESLKKMGVDGQEHNYPISNVTVSFLQAPQTLRIALGRFRWVYPTQSLLSRWFPKIFPPIPGHCEKISHPVEAPEILSFKTKDGRVHRYQLVGCVLHIGDTPTSGHYTAGCTREGERYIMNDASEIVHVNDEASEARWQDEISRARLLHYQLIADPDPEPAQDQAAAGG